MNAAAKLAESYLGDKSTSTTPKYKAREDGSTMKALVWHGARNVSIQDKPVPAITEPDDIVLRVTGELNETPICFKPLLTAVKVPPCAVPTCISITRKFFSFRMV